MRSGVTPLIPTLISPVLAKHECANQEVRRVIVRISLAVGFVAETKG